jgi:hypothetical protein
MPEPDDATRSPSTRRPRKAGPTSGRALVQLLAVLVVAAACLRAADAIPALLTGAPRGVRQFDDVRALERDLGWKIPMPSYFPDILKWPPSVLRAFGRSAATLLFVRRDNADPWLLLGVASGQNEALPPELATGTLVLQEGVSHLGGQPARVRRVRDDDGTAWTELTWRLPGRVVLMRYRGPLDELEMIASSLQGSRP